MLLGKRHLSVRHAASTDPTRHDVNSVRLEPDGTTVATDGHMLIRSKLGRDAVNEFPIIDNPPSDTEELDGPISLAREDVEKLVKSIPKKGLSVLKNAALDIAGTNGSGVARFTTTDLSVKQVHEVRKIEDEYPDYRQVLPKGKPVMSFAINLALLQRVVKAFVDAGLSDKENGTPVIFELFDAIGPIRIRPQPQKGLGKDEIFEAIVMSMRCEDQVWPEDS